MNTTKTWIQQADDALRRAALRAREAAARTNTPLLVQRDGKLVRLSISGGGSSLRHGVTRSSAV
jgi:hypothetical protein